MQKRPWWKPVGLILLIILCIMYVLPSFLEEKLPLWYNEFFGRRLNYGLDLRGGLELRYTVDFKKAIQDNVRKSKDDILNRLIEEIKGKPFADVPSSEVNELKAVITTFQQDNLYDILFVQFSEKKLADKLDQAFLKKYYPDFGLADTDTLGDGRIQKTLKVLDARIAQIKKDAIKKTLDIITKRVEAFGLAEPIVRMVGDTDIEVQLPGLKKSQMETVKERIGQTAQLTFRMVDFSDAFGKLARPYVQQFKERFPERSKTIKYEVNGSFVSADKKSELVYFVKYLRSQRNEEGRSIIPDDRIIGFGESSTQAEKGGFERVFWRTYYLQAKVELHGEHITRAQVFFEQNGDPYVSLEMDTAGARIFEKVTTDHAKEYMAIMLDEDVQSAPQIQGPIPGGRARITLGGTRSQREMLEEAQGLTTVLTHGAYKAPVHMVYDNEVGPSLGKHSIDQGKVAMIVGAALVILFMIMYYKVSGVIANIALLLNVLFVMTILVSFNSFLTLPGIAGIILTIGMAVDANVIIFERVREEIRAGKSSRAAIDSGYSKALSTILDANITTAIAGIVLLTYTSGPVYGFAVTLLAGIACSVFTAVFVTRMIFDWLLNKGFMKELSI